MYIYIYYAQIYARKKKQAEGNDVSTGVQWSAYVDLILEIANHWLWTKRVKKCAKTSPSSAHCVEDLRLLVPKCASNTLQSCVGWNRSSNTWRVRGKQLSALVYLINEFLVKEKRKPLNFATIFSRKVHFINEFLVKEKRKPPNCATIFSRKVLPYIHTHTRMYIYIYIYVYTSYLFL